MIQKIFVKQINRTWSDGRVRFAILRMINILPEGELQIGHVVAKGDLQNFMNNRQWEVDIT